MSDDTEVLGEIERAMQLILERLLEEDLDITARAVARLHPTLKAASSITRNSARRALLSAFQARQAELRRWRISASKQSAFNSAATLAAKCSQIKELEANVQLLTASHVAMLRVVGELGGFAKWAQFYKSYAAIRLKLETLDKSAP